jgi:histidyl-tRNA synthetase
MKTETVKGFKDYSGEDALKRAEVKKLLVDTFEKYGFEPAETPVVEYEEFVKGDNDKDEAVSDIFKLQDKGKRNLALRYEFTFQLKRLMQNKKLPYKRYQLGEVFRDEPVSANRFRQFVQCDVDVIGSKIQNEAEILSLAKEVLDKIGIDFIIYFNNRKLLNEILDKEGIKEKESVMKELDKLDKISGKEVKENLKKYNAEKILNIFKDKEKLEKYSSYSEIKGLEKYLKDFGVKAEFQPTLSRGLSYYNGTIFEIKTSQLKETITAGGSYMFADTQCTGISFGLDRLSSLAKVKDSRNKVLIVSLNEDKQAIKIAKQLREIGNCVSMFYGKPSKAMEYANSYNIEQVIFVGAEEVKKKKFKVKDMNTGKEKTLVLEKKIKKNVVVQRK